MFMINSAFEQFLSDTMYWSTFVYVSVSLSAMIILGIQQNNKTTEIGRQCHFVMALLKLMDTNVKYVAKSNRFVM